MFSIIRLKKGILKMDIQNITNKETAIQNEQQLKTKQEIINDIIKIFADNVISISEAHSILHETSKKLKIQPVSTVTNDVKQIYRMRNTGEIKY